MIQQLRLSRNPWHCDCEVAYLAMWLRKINFWQSGAGAICLGPGTLGGKLVIELTFHQLCDGQWASMRGLAPRLPVELLTPSPPKSVQ
ncbi:hypothetical protein KQX54_000153 [Cotesia glomerata]|nr:hypothetical protein KQX54_000153 [Cotesia glomerata]